MDIVSHYLYPSTIWVAEERTSITTILGSCIAVCLYDEKLKIGGMNHYMLPFWNGEGLASPKYGDIAISRLMENVKNLGSQEENLIVKIFGGANQFVEDENINDRLRVGDRNIKLAKQFFKERNIKIKAESVGGKIGRKILFDTYTGEVRMKYLNKKSV